MTKSEFEILQANEKLSKRILELEKEINKLKFNNLEFGCEICNHPELYVIHYDVFSYFDCFIQGKANYCPECGKKL